VIVPAAAAAVIAVLLLARRDLTAVLRLPLRVVWLAWAALGLQVLALEVLADRRGAAAALHLLTYGLAAVWVVANRRTPGIPVIAVGGALNLAAITANDGVMPASAGALAAAGLGGPGSAGGAAAGDAFANSALVDGARLGWLGDVFAVPAGWPLANVFSVGDVVLVAGLAVLLVRATRRDLASGPPLAGAVPGQELPRA
jgi:hypothetical protein